MLKRLLLACLAACTASCAEAADYSDIWWNPTESGWGVNFAQNENFIFATFFIYGPNSAPTWYTGQMSLSGAVYTGPLYATTGPYFGVVPFNPAQVTIAQVGTVTFQPTAADVGTLSYNVGAVSVTKTIQRQTLTTIALSASYRGGLVKAVSACANPGLNGKLDQFTDINVTQLGNNQVEFDIFLAGGAICTLAGTLQQFGQLYRVLDAFYSCSNGLSINTTATMYEIKATAQGIEGRWLANIGGGCVESATFSAVLR